MNIQGWFPLGWTGWISLPSKGLSRVFSSTTVRKHQLSGLSLPYGPALMFVHDDWETTALTLQPLLDKCPPGRCWGKGEDARAHWPLPFCKHGQQPELQKAQLVKTDHFFLQCRRRYNTCLSYWRSSLIVIAHNSPSEDGFSHHDAPQKLTFLGSAWVFKASFPLVSKVDGHVIASSP